MTRGKLHESHRSDVLDNKKFFDPELWADGASRVRRRRLLSECNSRPGRLGWRRRTRRRIVASMSLAKISVILPKLVPMTFNLAETLFSKFRKLIYCDFFISRFLCP